MLNEDGFREEEPKREEALLFGAIEEAQALIIVLCLFTILVAEEVINLFFPEVSGGLTSRVLGKLVLDTALVTSGFAIKKHIVGKALLFAGLARYVLIFFHLQGVEPVARTATLLVVTIVILAAGIITFGKSDEADKSKREEE